MFITPALAGHGVTNTGSTGGANALLIILAAIIVLGLVYFGQKKLRSRSAARNDDQPRGE